MGKKIKTLTKKEIDQLDPEELRANRKNIKESIRRLLSRGYTEDSQEITIKRNILEYIELKISEQISSSSEIINTHSNDETLIEHDMNDGQSIQNQGNIRESHCQEVKDTQITLEILSEEFNNQLQKIEKSYKKQLLEYEQKIEEKSKKQLLEYEQRMEEKYTKRILDYEEKMEKSLKTLFSEQRTQHARKNPKKK